MVSRRGVSVPPWEMIVSATHTMEEESMPPLSSARMGLSERSLRRTASAKTARKCSSYSPSVRRSEEHTSELQSPDHLVCRLLLEKKKTARRHAPGVVSKAVTI